jgi:hypothetical protein
MGKYRKIPSIIEAEQFTYENKDRCLNFVTCNTSPGFDEKGQPILKIQTLAGIMTVSIGEWVIKGIQGEFYPCAPDIFEATYEKA